MTIYLNKKKSLLKYERIRPYTKNIVIKHPELPIVVEEMPFNNFIR